jgi:hypothetical protein
MPDLTRVPSAAPVAAVSRSQDGETSGPQGAAGSLSGSGVLG